MELTAEQKQVLYVQMVVNLIRERYSQDDEFAILRKNMAGIEPNGFDEYNLFVEGCKAEAKSELELT